MRFQQRPGDRKPEAEAARAAGCRIGLAGGESLLEVSRRLGHSFITITADTSSHVSAATAAESAKRLAQLIDDAS